MDLGGSARRTERGQRASRRFSGFARKGRAHGGSINLKPDKTCSGTLSARVTDLTSGASTTFTTTAGGTFSSAGGSITLTDATDGSQLTGSVGGGTLTISDDLGVGAPITLVFKR